MVAVPINLGCAQDVTWQYAAVLSTVVPNNGQVAGGTDITITGSNFILGSVVVTIGGTPVVNANIANNTAITCTTPNGTVGSQEIVVTFLDGQTVTMPDGFTYNP
jgi:hypothetical protein